jgi:hypothetical protein
MAATKSDAEVGDGVKESEKVLLGDVHDAERPGESVDPSGMSAPWDSRGGSSKRQQRRARSPGCCCKVLIFSANRAMAEKEVEKRRKLLNYSRQQKAPPSPIAMALLFSAIGEIYSNGG